MDTRLSTSTPTRSVGPRRISGTLEKTAAGIVFTQIVATMEVAVAKEHRERTLTLVESAKKYCIVSNALEVPVTVEAVVTAA